MGHYEWTRLVRFAEQMMTFNPEGRAYAMLQKEVLRGLEDVCPDAWRALVASK